MTDHFENLGPYLVFLLITGIWEMTLYRTNIYKMMSPLLPEVKIAVKLPLYTHLME